MQVIFCVKGYQKYYSKEVGKQDFNTDTWIAFVLNNSTFFRYIRFRWYITFILFNMLSMSMRDSSRLSCSNQ